MIGDVLASTVICEGLRHHFPKAIIHMVANENTLPVLINNPYIDEVVVFKNEYRNSKKAFHHFLKSLKKTKYDAVIDAYGKLESNLISLFAKADKKIADRKWYTSWVYTDTVNQVTVPNDEIPLSVSNRLMLLNPLVPKSNFIAYPKLYLSATERQTAKSAIAKLKDHEEQKIIMIGILGSASHKTYPAEYMAKILDVICARCDVKMLFNYIPTQKKEALQIFELCSQETKNKIAIDFYASSLREFIGLLSQCDMLIGNEGGAVNMAKALDLPTFCVFSPFIIKGAWHAKVHKNHKSVHLRDYRPELFGNMNKKQIKTNIQDLYNAFEPAFFEQKLLDFLKQNCT